MDKLTNLVSELKKAIDTSNKKTSPYDTTAVVRRVDADNRTLWVHIPGGVDETPVKMSINAEVGDNVNIRVSGGTAWVVGNETAPPTDDRTAIIARKAATTAHAAAKTAEETAITAQTTATGAQESANEAQETANTAWAYAGTAAQAAEEAQASADSARESAIVANNAANNALTQLSVVEDVAGTLSWIQDHGSYVATTDTTVNADKIYFEFIDGDYVPIANPDPTANPSTEGWYVLDVSDSQAQYIMAHLAVTSAGLWVLPVNGMGGHPLVDSEGNEIVDSNGNVLSDWRYDPQNASGYKVLLSGTGMIVFNGEGAAVARYGETTTIGEASGKNVFIDNDSVDIKDGETVLAKFGEKTIIGMDQTGGFMVESNLSSIHASQTEEGEFQTSGICSLIRNPKDVITVDVTTDRMDTVTTIFNKGTASEETISVSSKDCTIQYDGALTFTFTSSTYETTTLYYIISYPYYFARMSLGSENHPNGSSTATIGTGLTSWGRDQLVVGRYNESDSTLSKKYLFVIGNGANKNERANVFSVNEDGDVYFSGYLKNDNRVLWTGARYMFDDSGQTITLGGMNSPEKSLSKQNTGYVLVWSAYLNGEAKDYDWVYYFVPKWHASLSGTGGIGIHLGKASTNGNGQAWAVKYLYIVETGTSSMPETTISGYSGNNQGNAAGYVLRAVLGV